MQQMIAGINQKHRVQWVKQMPLKNNTQNTDDIAELPIKTTDEKEWQYNVKLPMG